MKEEPEIEMSKITVKVSYETYCQLIVRIELLEAKVKRMQSVIETIADGEAEQDSTEYEAFRIMTGN